MPPETNVVNAKQHLANMEGLRNVVVGAVLEPRHPVDGCASSRDHDDRDIAHGSDLTCQLEAVLLTKTEIESDEVNGFGFEIAEESRLVCSFQHHDTLLLKRLAQNDTECSVILDDKNMNRSVCVGSCHRCDLGSDYYHLQPQRRAHDGTPCFRSSQPASQRPGKGPTEQAWSIASPLEVSWRRAGRTKSGETLGKRSHDPVAMIHYGNPYSHFPAVQESRTWHVATGG